MNEENKTLEEMVADAITEQPNKIKLSDKEYVMNPPTVGTLILFSKEVSKIPKVSQNDETIDQFVLRTAKDMRCIGRAFATALIGAKELRKESKWYQKVYRFLTRKKSRLEELTDELIDTLSTKDFFTLYNNIIKRMDVSLFFALTTFLAGINQTKPKREVEEKTTASGQ